MEFEVEVSGYDKDGNVIPLGTLEFEAKDMAEASNIAVAQQAKLVKPELKEMVRGFGFKWIKPTKEELNAPKLPYGLKILQV